MAKKDVIAIPKKQHGVGKHESAPIDLEIDTDVVRATLEMDLADKQAEPGPEEEVKVMIQVSHDGGLTWRDAFGFGWKPYGPGGIDGNHPDPFVYSDMSQFKGKKIKIVKTVQVKDKNSGVTVNL